MMNKELTMNTDNYELQQVLKAVSKLARRPVMVAMLLAVLIALPTVELRAQDCINFEINPDPDSGGVWIEGTPVTDQYEADYGIKFSVVLNGTHLPLTGPVIAEAGEPFCAFVNNDDPQIQCDPDLPITDRDYPNYTSVSPFTYPPDDPLDDIGCFFLTDHDCGPTTPNIMQFALRVTYTIECYQLSGRFLDNDVHFGVLPEGWTVEAYGTVSNVPDTLLSSTGNIPPVDTNSSGTVDIGDGEGAIQSFSIDVTSLGVPIDYVDIKYSGSAPFENVGLGFDNFCPCSIDEGGCGQVIVPDINCDLATPGSYNYSFHIGNDSGFDVVKILIPDVDLGDGSVINVEPNIIETFIPNVTSSDKIDLTFSGGAAGVSFPLVIGLMAKNDEGEYFECCSLETQIELPHCCNELIDAQIQWADPGDGTLVPMLLFNVENSTYLPPDPANHLFLVPIDPPWMTMDEDYFYLGSAGVADNNQTGLLSTQLGLDPLPGSGSITFEVVIHNEDFSECCNEIHTVAIEGGDGDGEGASLPFVRGDSNNDGLFDIGDVVFLLDFFFAGGPSAACSSAGDSNGDSQLDVGDAIYILGTLFAGGTNPPPPFPNCGIDPNQETDSLDCLETLCP